MGHAALLFNGNAEKTLYRRVTPTPEQRQFLQDQWNALAEHLKAKLPNGATRGRPILAGSSRPSAGYRLVKRKGLNAVFRDLKSIGGSCPIWCIHLQDEHVSVPQFSVQDRNRSNAV